MDERILSARTDKQRLYNATSVMLTVIEQHTGQFLPPSQHTHTHTHATFTHTSTSTVLQKGALASIREAFSYIQPSIQPPPVAVLPSPWQRRNMRTNQASHFPVATLEDRQPQSEHYFRFVTLTPR
mmetsp:Transcript_29540/g.85477  ORF Transcript_29540/g.85477 Transcript_29540/m.85477 type:complete len:126 (-) Transcript_29540:512-889(-)